jgi:hypothetical protein
MGIGSVLHRRTLPVGLFFGWAMAVSAIDGEGIPQRTAQLGPNEPFVVCGGGAAEVHRRRVPPSSASMSGEFFPSYRRQEDL